MEKIYKDRFGYTWDDLFMEECETCPRFDKSKNINGTRPCEFDPDYTGDCFFDIPNGPIPIMEDSTVKIKRKVKNADV